MPSVILKYLKWPLIFVAVLWAIEGMSVYFNFRLYEFGIIPRTISGIPGIFLSPFIHGNYEHLLSNTLPLLVIGTGMIYFYRDIAIRVIGMIWLFTGFWVWLAARSSSHIGASGIIYGLVCFLFFSGLLRKDTRLLAVSMLVVFLYGSMVWGILPVDQTISWESHLFGSVAGIFCAIYFRKLGPQRPKVQWEIDEELEDLNDSEDEGMEDMSEEDKNNEEIIIKYDYIDKKDSPNEEGGNKG